MKLAVLRALKNRVREVELELNADFLDQLDAGDSKAATLEDGTRLGKVTKVGGRETPVVVNEKELLAWVETHYPTEIELTVRPAFRDKVLASAKTHGVAVDERTGEIIPGVELRTGQSYISFRSEKGFQEVVAARWPELIGRSLLDGEPS